MKNTIRNSISERLQEALNMRDMKQADLVRITGIGKASINTYIAGSYEPKQKNIYKLAKALNVSEAWLMGYDQKKEEEVDTEKVKELCEPLIKYLKEECDPYVEIVISSEMIKVKRTDLGIPLS